MERPAPRQSEEHHDVAPPVTGRPLGADAALQMQRSRGNRATARAFERSRAPEVATVLPKDHPDERAADRLADDALVGGRLRAPAALTTARSRSGGRPLDPTVRTSMEGAFGASFTAVRVHDDARADGLSRSIGALAFTSGPDIFFRGGAHDPGSPGGQRLLAHELAHVVQQARAPAATPVIHRYTLVDSDDDVGQVQWSASNTFVRQSKGDNDFLADDDEAANIATHDGSAGVTLKVSEDYELAVEALDGENQAKAYYASQDNLEDTNDKLAETESAFEMIAQAGETLTLTRPDSSTEELHKVYPINRVTPKGNVRTPAKGDIEETEGLAMRSRQQCIELASAVIGQTSGAPKDAYMKLGRGHDGHDDVRDLIADVGLVGTGALNTQSQVGSLTNFIGDLDEIAAASETGAALVLPLKPLFVELKGCVLNDQAPSVALLAMLHEYTLTDSHEDIPALAKLAALASSDRAKGVAGLVSEVYTVVKQYAAFHELRLIHASADADAFDQASGINAYARPEVGEAYQIRYLQRRTGDWNYHWAGVVARDGADSVTLENFTRDTRVAENRFRDARWYFDMYGVGRQSFHAAYSAFGAGEMMTSVHATRPSSDEAEADEPLSREAALSREFAGRLAVIRRALIAGSGARHNAAYNEIVELLNECAALAIDASADPSQYRALVERADRITVAYDRAISTKREAREARNAALAAMKRDLVALKKEAFRVYLNLHG